MKKIRLVAITDEKRKLSNELIVEALVTSELIRVADGFVYFKKQNDAYWSKFLLGSAELQVLLRKEVFEEANKVSKAQMEKVLEDLSVDPRVQVGVNHFTHPDYINCRNGVLCLSTAECTAHGEKNLDFDYLIDINYSTVVSEDEFPNFREFLEASVGCEWGSKKTKYLLESLGYLLSDNRTLRQSVIFLGGSGCGKSTLAKVIERCILPMSVVSAVTLGQFGNKFDLEVAIGTKLNLCNELESGKAKNWQIFKMLAAKEHVVVDKKYSQPRKVLPRAQLLFCGNQLPDLPTEDVGAIISRLNVIQFSGDVNESQRDLHLGEKLYEEKDSFLSFALQAFTAVLHRNGSFTIPDDTKRLVGQYLEEQESISAFIKERLIFGENQDGLHHQELEGEYEMYCKENLLPKKPYRKLKAQLLRVPSVEERRFRRGKNLRGLLGLGFRKG